MVYQANNIVANEIFASQDMVEATCEVLTAMELFELNFIPFTS